MIKKVEVEGLNELVASINSIVSGKQDAIARGMTTAMLRTHDRLPGYPPEPPNSTYVRTLELGRKIYTDVETIGGDTVGVIGDPVVYAPWVISDEEIVGGIGPQAKVHKGRWWILQEEVRKAMPEIASILGDALIDLVTRRR